MVRQRDSCVPATHGVEVLHDFVDGGGICRDVHASELCEQRLGVVVYDQVLGHL